MTAIRKPLPSRLTFVARLARGLAIGGGIVAGSLGAGVLGYHELAGLPWIDALLNAAMILTGMGPVDELTTVRAKLFASCYALFSGVAFLSVVAVVFAPVVQRFLHRFHLELSEDSAASQRVRSDPGSAAGTAMPSKTAPRRAGRVRAEP